MTPSLLILSVSPFSLPYPYLSFLLFLTSSDSVRPAGKSPMLMAPEMSACSYRNQSSISSASPQTIIVPASEQHALSETSLQVHSDSYKIHSYSLRGRQVLVPSSLRPRRSYMPFKRPKLHAPHFIFP
jgi:hypothetical protein